MNTSKEMSATLTPVRKSIRVSLPVEEAFRLFTDGINSWWPVKTHSIGEGRVVSCSMEGRAGGRIYETLDDGSQADWGTVVRWDPPASLAFTWHPGRSADTAQQVTVSFEAVAGGTRLDLVHRGWELLGERAQELRESYDSGWDYVLGKYLAQSAA